MHIKVDYEFFNGCLDVKSATADFNKERLHGNGQVELVSEFLKQTVLAEYSVVD